MQIGSELTCRSAGTTSECAPEGISYAEARETEEHPAKGGAEQDASTKEDASEAQKYPASFNAIVNLIATGQEDKIPGVRNIPLIINQEKPSESKMERPKNPWE